MGSARPSSFLLISACLGVAVAAVLAVFFVWVAVTVPFPDEVETFVETADRIWTEVLVIPIAACFGYAAWGLVQFMSGRRVRWRLVACAYVAGAIATPLAWVFLIGTYSGG